MGYLEKNVEEIGASGRLLFVVRGDEGCLGKQEGDGECKTGGKLFMVGKGKLWRRGAAVVVGGRGGWRAAMDGGGGEECKLGWEGMSDGERMDSALMNWEGGDDSMRGNLQDCW
ncbi:unnamed protein product [Calypogeia fissa]